MMNFIFTKLLLKSHACIILDYIDPGTGSMLFTILIGLFGVAVYGAKSLSLKIKNYLGFLKKDKTKYEYVIYSDSKRYWNVFCLICDEFEKRKIELNYLTQSEDDPVFSKKSKYIKPHFIGEGQKGYTYLNFLNADILLSTTPSLDVFQWKRSKQTRYYIHIPHACSDITLYRMYGIDYYDAILLSGYFQIEQVRKLEKLRNLPAKDLKIVGLTYFDELKRKLNSARKKDNVTPIVLLAPSWGPSSILNRYGERFIDSLIETGYKVIIRPHPQSYTSEKELIDKLSQEYPDLEWNRDNDNFDVLNKADILISDFSGVIFDFTLVFNKPVIYADTSFNDSVYDAHWLNEELWTFKTLKKIGRKLEEKDFDNIRSVIDECLYSSVYENARKEAIGECWNNIGFSAETIADYMVNKHNELFGEEA